MNAGTEGVGVLSEEEIAKLKDTPSNDVDAARFLVETVNKFPNQIEITCLGKLRQFLFFDNIQGGLTNIAYACILDKEFEHKVKHITWMAMGHRMNEKQTELFPFMDPKSSNLSAVILLY